MNIGKGLAAGFALFVSFAAAMPDSDVPPPPKIYKIRCASAENSQKADAYIGQLSLLGYGPCEIIDKNGKRDILVGKFATKPEAWKQAEYMKESGLWKTEVLELDNTAGENFDTLFQGPKDRVLIPKQPRLVPIKEAAANPDDGLALVRQAVQSKDFEAVLLTAPVKLQGREPSDPATGFLKKEIGRAIVLRDKKTMEALPYFMDVAKGEVAATEEDVLDAQLMVADSWHYYWFAPLKAYRAYGEILDAHGEANPGVKARCLTERAACLLEMARMPDQPYQPSFDSARRACLIVKNEVPPQFARAHAVADLMYCESFMFEGELSHNPAVQRAGYQKSLEAFEGFAERHPSCGRECAMALFQVGYIHGTLGEFGDAERCLLEVAQSDLIDDTNPKDRFHWGGGGIELHSHAAKWLARFARQAGKESLGREMDALAVSKEQSPAPQQESNAGSSFDTAFPHSMLEESVQ